MGWGGRVLAKRQCWTPTKTKAFWGMGGKRGGGAPGRSWDSSDDLWDVTGDVG